jgi:hypothetical protein
MLGSWKANDDRIEQVDKGEVGHDIYPGCKKFYLWSEILGRMMFGE